MIKADVQSQQHDGNRDERLTVNASRCNPTLHLKYITCHKCINVNFLRLQTAAEPQ